MGETSALGSLLLKHNYAVHLKSERPVPRGSERCSHEAGADPHQEQKAGMASSSHLPLEEPASSNAEDNAKCSICWSMTSCSQQHPDVW